MPTEMPEVEAFVCGLLGIRPHIDVEQNSFIQLLMNKGRIEQARTLILRIGEKRLGAPTDQVKAARAGTTDLNRLEELGVRLLDVSSWDDLLAAP